MRKKLRVDPSLAHLAGYLERRLKSVREIRSFTSGERAEVINRFHPESILEGC